MLRRLWSDVKLFVFRSIFLQTSCCQVGSPREIYPKVHKEIINLTCMIFCSISMYLFHIPSRVCKQKQYCVCTEGHRHLIYVIATAIGWTIPRGPREIADLHLCIPRGMVAAILFPVDQFMCDWLNHITWFHSNRALHWSMESESMLLHFFYTIQTSIWYVGCLMIANTWIYISLYLKNTAILENKKSVSIFPHQLVNTCDLHIHTS